MAMSGTRDREEIRAVVREELPRLLREDEEIRAAVARAYALVRGADEDACLHRVLKELRESREAEAYRWDQQAQQWKEQNRRWDEQAQQWKAQNRRWDEQAQQWKEQNRRWDEQDRKWHEVHEEIMAGHRRLQTSISAIGARWAMQSESAYRNGLRALLESSFEVKVDNMVEFDDRGEVFGRPDQVEVDVVVHDSKTILIEIKSSMSRPDMYVFERKIRFYEKRLGKRADRAMVISPMIDPRAAEIAKSFHIECFSHTLDIQGL